MNSSAHRLVPLWLQVFFWLAVIAYFSNQPFSKQDLAPVLEKHRWLIQATVALPEVQFRYGGTVFSNRRDPVRFLQFCLRKAAHLCVPGMGVVYRVKVPNDEGGGSR